MKRQGSYHIYGKMQGKGPGAWIRAAVREKLQNCNKKIGVSRRILRWCGRRESNPHTMKVTEPKSVESASSTTPA